MRRLRRRFRLGARHVPFGRTVIVAQLLVATAVVGYLVSRQDPRVPFSDPFELEVAFTDANGLRAGDKASVTVAGVPLGRVKEVRYEAGRAIARLELSDEARGRIRADATAEVVPRSALNDRTIDILPGTSSARPVASGSLIPASRTQSYVSSDRVIDVIDADTRAQMQILIGQLRVGMQGRAASGLRSAVARLGPLVEHGGDVAGALAQRRKLLTRLVDELDVIFTTLGRRGQQLTEVVGYGAATLRVSGARQPELEASFRELPATVDGLRRALDALGRLSVPLDPTLARLRPFARRLPAGLRALRSFLPEGRALVEDLVGLTRQGRAVASLGAALRELGAAAPSLQAPIDDLVPILEAIDRDKDGIGKLGENFSGVFSTNDANGPILRGLGAFEPFDPANLGMPGARGTQLRRLKRDASAMLEAICREQNDAACLARFLVPGLPGAVVPVSAAPRIVSGRGAP